MHCGISATADGPVVRIMWLDEKATLICHFRHSVAAHNIVWAGLFPRYTLLLGCYATKGQTNYWLLICSSFMDTSLAVCAELQTFSVYLFLFAEPWLHRSFQYPTCIFTPDLFDHFECQAFTFPRWIHVEVLNVCAGLFCVQQACPVCSVSFFFSPWVSYGSV